ncbi:hypothetical protein BRAS3809_620004 [Bradyrhizobium sp. STM 3809]|nr:hypothetical protein BRAS3809_620004 [Bradyrhizobium sp. STM 3809]
MLRIKENLIPPLPATPWNYGCRTNTVIHFVRIDASQMHGAVHERSSRCPTSIFHK